MNNWVYALILALILLSPVINENNPYLDDPEDIWLQRALNGMHGVR